MFLTPPLLLPACGNWGLLGLIEGRLPVMDSCLAGRDVMLLLSSELDIKIKITQPTQSVMLWGYADCNGLTPRVGIITARPGQAGQWTPNLLMIPQYWWFRLVFVSVSATHCSHLIIILVSVRSSRSQLCFSINWQDRDWSATLQSRIKTDWLTDWQTTRPTTRVTHPRLVIQTGPLSYVEVIHYCAFIGRELLSVACDRSLMP